MVRPRKLEIDQALEVATHLFWRKGFEGTSVAELTDAMGVTPPSFYFAFGSKEELFRRVYERYRTHHLSYVAEALAAPTAREVAEQMLSGGIEAVTTEGCPPGCLGMSCAGSGAGESAIVSELLAEGRAGQITALRRRFAAAKADGDLPAQADAAALARYIQIVGMGMSVAAQQGVQRRELKRVAEMAMSSWPEEKFRPQKSGARAGVSGKSSK